MELSAVIPTRGDQDLGPIVSHLLKYPEVKEIMIEAGDTPFNRYLAMARARFSVIYTQDDDCITDLRPLIEAYRPGLIVNAMTPQHAAAYTGAQTLIGFGAIFDAGLAKAMEGWQRDALFLRESDRVFATLNPHFTVFPEIKILDYAHAPNRYWKQPDHVPCMDAINARIKQFQERQ